MVAWNASRNNIHLPTLLDKLILDTKIRQIVISISKTFESRSIRASSFSTGSFYVTEVMMGSIVVMKNTWKQPTMASSWCTIELHVKDGGRAKVLMIQHSK
jgi:hypothetical protein